MIRVAVAGAAGRMGNALIQAVSLANDLSLGSAFEHNESPLLGRDAGEIAGIGNAGVVLERVSSDKADCFDVIIDFTIPEATISLAEICLKNSKAMVIGTTGFDSVQLARLQEISRDIPIFLSPNMSLGVNLMFKLVEVAAAALGDEMEYEVQEAHHSQKVDSPSGTAVKLGEILSRILSRDLEEAGVYGRKGMVGERKGKEIGFSSIRGGDIVGDHTVFFIGEGERIEITHRAQSRKNFARGALTAVRYIDAKETGFFDMQKLMGF